MPSVEIDSKQSSANQWYPNKLWGQLAVSGGMATDAAGAD
jgi:hypothetical protein